ncbi:MAG: tRNA glutamyl-Q(34) synthetase GluQRS [Pseudomonadales bacterium]|nr:tRNA glutamyl-Q(34) synthetase GluQRS [Pseudomonadales bacterium]
MSVSSQYVGRFAPSPTGPLHFGSLVTAMASYLDARARGGTWLLRIEDLDPPRESAEAPAIIMDQLRAFGLDWDGDAVFQHTRKAAYDDALAQLEAKGLLYPCTCSRKTAPTVYDGACRARRFEETRDDYAVRVRIDVPAISFNDRKRGHATFRSDTEVGDFIVKRKDGLHAYHLAVVVDDCWQGVTDIVRGDDLFDSTPRHIYLQHCLNLPTPTYAHLPVVVDASGDKLSKQTHAAAIDATDPLPQMRLALEVLGQPVHRGISNRTTLLARAVDHWNIDRVPSASFRLA